MREEVRTLLERFPVRKTKKQKAAFRDWLCAALCGAGYAPVTESGSLGSRNVVVGDPDTAKVVFTAHYDTPARLPWPNFIVPQNFFWTLVCQLPLMAMLFAPALVIEIALIALGAGERAALLGFAAAIWGALALVYVGPANPSNVNDNSSGVAALLEIALALPPEQRGGVAFVFFDNEEKGLLGSSAFAKAHKARMTETVVINFDCVADGDHIRFYPTAALKKREDMLACIEQSFEGAGKKNVAVVRGFGYYPSDQKHFPLGVGVAALHRRKFIGYCLGRIHTSRDTVFEQENIDILRRGALRLAALLAAQTTKE